MKSQSILTTGLAAMLMLSADGAPAGATAAATITLGNLDVTIIVDKSGSMGTKDMPGGLSRTQYCSETLLPLVDALGKVDDDGLDMYFYNRSFTHQEKVTAATFAAAWAANEPGGGSAMAPVLEAALKQCISRFGEKNQLIIVVTDGMPDDKEASAQAIVAATKQMKTDDQMAILFLQAGGDQGAADYLKYLDDDLVGVLGAAFDIVDCKTIDEIAGKSLQQIVDTAFND